MPSNPIPTTSSPLFSHCGGHPALDWVNSLDNRFRSDGPDELLQSYADLLRFTEQSALLTAPQSQHLAKTVAQATATRTLRSALDLREAAATIIYQALDGTAPNTTTGAPPAAIARNAPTLSTTSAPVATGISVAARNPATNATTPALALLEHHLTEARAHQHLQWCRTTQKLSWAWHSPDIEPQRPLWLLAIQTSDLLMSDDMGRLRACECDTCRWLFLDTSKNRSRRWCDMKVCGNRMKARRFQARREPW
jgi:predicted RNA-binding Zn ribbon-like protein